MDGIHPYDTGAVLDQYGIAVRTGHHCAQPLMDRLGVPGTVRASLSFYNTRDEIDALALGLEKVKKLFYKTPFMPTIQEKARQIVEELNQFDEWLDKYEYLIEKGKTLPVIDPEQKTDENLINGCQSKVWLIAEILDNGSLIFKADSDALITRGLVSLIVEVYSQHTPDEIIAFEPVFIEEAGLQQHLSPNRANGLMAMIKQIKFYAMAWKSNHKTNTKRCPMHSKKPG